MTMMVGSCNRAIRTDLQNFHRFDASEKIQMQVSSIEYSVS